MLKRSLFLALVIGCVTAASGLSLAPRSTAAQGIVSTCSQLWHQRNGIYASMGHCFKRQKSKMCFPNNCFPPYGKLTPAQQRQVAQIRAQERAIGCNYNLVNVGLLGC